MPWAEPVKKSIKISVNRDNNWALTAFGYSAVNSVVNSGGGVYALQVNSKSDGK